MIFFIMDVTRQPDDTTDERIIEIERTDAEMIAFLLVVFAGLMPMLASLYFRCSVEAQEDL